MADPLWSHRPKIEEYDAALTAMKEADYPSVSAFVREAVVRLTYAEDKRPLFSQLRDRLATATELVEDLYHLETEYQNAIAGLGEAGASLTTPPSVDS